MIKCDEYNRIIKSKGQTPIRILTEVFDLIEKHLQGEILNVNQYASEKLLIAILKDIEERKENNISKICKK